MVGAQPTEVYRQLIDTAIAEEEAGRRVIGDSFDNLLCRPCGRGGVGDVEVHDLSPMMQEHYEHVEHAEHRRGHDEEVDRDKIGDVIFEEGPPGLRGRFRTARHEPTTVRCEMPRPSLRSSP